MAETFDGRAETLALQFQLREIDADLQELRATVTPRTSQDMRDQIFALELLRMDMQQSIAAVPNPQGLTPRPPPTAFECVACNEEHPANGMITCNCGHRYCHDCAIEMVRSSLTDINLFPPQCCDAPIQLETRWSFMTAELWERVRQRKIEINVVAPTYCSNAICSRLLLPADITNSVGTCPDCERRTCLRCKERMHQGECLGDLFGHANVTALMTDNGWQRCPNCGHGVERRDGCPHMRYATLPDLIDLLSDKKITIDADAVANFVTCAVVIGRVAEEIAPVRVQMPSGRQPFQPLIKLMNQFDHCF